jgi:hypothetical protein
VKDILRSEAARMTRHWNVCWHWHASYSR